MLTYCLTYVYANFIITLLPVASFSTVSSLLSLVNAPLGTWYAFHWRQRLTGFWVQWRPCRNHRWIEHLQTTLPELIGQGWIFPFWSISCQSDRGRDDYAFVRWGTHATSNKNKRSLDFRSTVPTYWPPWRSNNRYSYSNDTSATYSQNILGDSPGYAQSPPFKEAGQTSSVWRAYLDESRTRDTEMFGTQRGELNILLVFVSWFSQMHVTSHQFCSLL